MADKEAAKKDEKKPADQAEGAAEGASEEEGGKKGLSKKMIMIIGAVASLVLIGGVVTTLFLTGVLGKKADSSATEQASGGTDSGANSADQKGKPVFYSLGDLLVNLSGEGKHPNFLKIKINLELADEKDLPLMDAIKPRIIDNFQVYLRELRIEDLRGSAGMYRLREELLLRVTEAAQPVRIRDVLFQEMLVQ